MKVDAAALRELLAQSRPAWPAAAILAATVVALLAAPPIPDSFAGLRGAGPYVALGIALALAWWFNRGRSFVVAASLAAAWALWRHEPSKAVYTAAVVLMPLNCLAALVLAERGARYGGALRWMVVLAAQSAAVLWLATGAPGALLEHWALRSPPTPLVGRVAFAAALAAALWRAYPDFRPLQMAHAGAIAAFFIAAEWAGDAAVSAAFLTAAGAILVVALMQESHQLAFRDELTGLLGRRALEERLRSLGARYAVAMVDVDHFKKFNDQHGHDVGDQVLKLVGARLEQVGGGGVAYRYGGEEFCVLFPDRGAAEAAAPLEALRGEIERYRMALRGGDRPRNPDDTQRLRLKKAPEKTLSVTVSIGLAEPTAARTPAQVLKAADEALYRAKQAGRNRLST
ncbi:MAG TPA: GGDEF domain-containing protein [Burkholderiales bacterium]|nr:GGDEF domain-containing protein [Burkholderiales bacterium]